MTRSVLVPATMPIGKLVTQPNAAVNCLMPIPCQKAACEFWSLECSACRLIAHVDLVECLLKLEPPHNLAQAGFQQGVLDTLDALTQAVQSLRSYIETAILVLKPEPTPATKPGPSPNPHKKG